MKLVAEVLDYAPATLSPAERLVLVVLAESANDKTREAWPGMDVITRRCGMSGRGVRAVFNRLAERELEVRVPLGTDKNGRPVYSRPGKRTTYRLPVFAGTPVPPNGGTDVPAFVADGGTPVPPSGENGGTPVPPNGGTTVPPNGENGGTTVPEWWHHRSGMAAPPFRPSLNEPSKNPHTSTASAPKETPPSATDDEWMPEATRIVLNGLRADHPAATVDDARAVHRLVAERYGSRVNLKWLRTMASNRSFTPFYADVKAARAEQIEEQIRELQRTNPPCEHDTPGGRLPHPTTGLPLCPMCRDGRPPLRRDGEQTHPDVLAALDAYRTHTTGRISAMTLMRITQEATALHRRHVPADQLVALAEKAARLNTGLLEAATQ